LCFETLNLLDKISFVFSYGHHVGKIELPIFCQNPEQTLRRLVYSRLRQKIRSFLQSESWFNEKVKNRYLERVEKELEVIEKKGLAGYFLMVYDFVNYARKQNIPVGPGRGSAVSSLVAYLLGITQIDPLRYDLIFERFLTLTRKDPPDIDLDLTPEGRDMLFEYAFKKYGSEHTSRLLTVNTFSFQTALAEVKEVTGTLLSDNEQKRVARRLSGLPRNFSQHPSGIILSNKKLSEIFPVIVNSEKKSIIQLRVEDISRLGIVKFDFLGLKILSVLDDTVKVLNSNEGISFQFEKIDLEDRNVYAMLSEGDTCGVFQFESEGFTNFLKEFAPRCFNDLILAIALYRPATLRSSLTREFMQKRRLSCENRE